jgi:thiol-disulfide isomerase/thioredoxin
MTTRTGLIALGLAALLGTVAVADSAPSAPRPATLAADAAFPATLRLVDIDGRPWTAADLRGRVVLVDFWATWCAPCLADLPRLQRLHARYGRTDLTILGVSVDRSAAREFRSWLQRQGIAWPQVRESGGFDGPLARMLGVQAVPSTFVYDRHGRLEAARLSGAALEARVTQLVEAR